MVHILIFCKLGIKGFRLIQKSKNHQNLFGNFNFLIPLNDFDQGYLRLQMRELFSNTIPGPSTKSKWRIGMYILTLFLPSLRSKLIWILEILLIVMITSNTNINNSSFSYWNILDKIINGCNSPKDQISRTIQSSCFILNPVDIG